MVEEWQKQERQEYMKGYVGSGKYDDSRLLQPYIRIPLHYDK